ncbi:hypothetical protein SAMN05443287_101235 [Micromonospora phaseoli]|uniref:Secreted protein n=1 Tax=Micromonospora phaseoli TaxID=1144548 RepID=A0A1H6RUM3_9ACTN|nr:hypothetical protein [Micromonospora phaseoli]PZW03491.1 hypothetical protein CLV64_101235 [Micromonospora phaseoli]GIJ77058.1 hypothetical protein Xph01_14900 [Micromonospora phaseoli]SEI54872.1 hypothetical protein SAMN05443287_101235 [Micromonospora phaseoli]
MDIRGTRRTAGRPLLALCLAAAALVGGLAPATPAAAATSCDFEMVSLRARNLQTDNGSQKDYVWLQVEDRWFPSGGDGVMFQLNQTRYPSSFGYPTAGFGSSGLEVRLVLDKWPTNITVERETIACDAVTGATRTFSNGDAVYDLIFNVTD